MDEDALVADPSGPRPGTVQVRRCPAAKGGVAGEIQPRSPSRRGHARSRPRSIVPEERSASRRSPVSELSRSSCNPTCSSCIRVGRLIVTYLRRGLPLDRLMAGPCRRAPAASWPRSVGRSSIPPPHRGCARGRSRRVVRVMQPAAVPCLMSLEEPALSLVPQWLGADLGLPTWRAVIADGLTSRQPKIGKLSLKHRAATPIISGVAGRSAAELRGISPGLVLVNRSGRRWPAGLACAVRRPDAAASDAVVRHRSTSRLAPASNIAHHPVPRDGAHDDHLRDA